MRKLTCIFQCCLWPSSYTAAGPAQVRAGALRAQLAFVFHFSARRDCSGHSGGTRPPPQPSPNCKEPRRASAHPPEVPLGPQGRATVSQAKLASSPMSQRGLP